MAVAAACVVATGCASSLGPGYLVRKQEIHVEFLAEPLPEIHVDASYELRNTGIRPLTRVDIRLPSHRFAIENLNASWDGQPAHLEMSSRQEFCRLQLAEPWKISGTHTLRINYTIASGSSGDALAFTKDAFFLPGEGWTPQLPQVNGVFGFGGVPPDKWYLTIKAPSDFHVHCSGKRPSAKKSGTRQTIRATQDAQTLYPFVVAGKYDTSSFDVSKQKIFLWTRTPGHLQDLPGAEELTRSLQAYASLFGAKARESAPIWIVECPVVPGCFTSKDLPFGRYLESNHVARTAEMIAPDTVITNAREGNASLAADAAPALAASWLGYGKNPGFYEQVLPMSALPAFAAAIGQQEAHGHSVRVQIVRRALRDVPEHATPGQQESEQVMRAKSLLLFYAMEDKYGGTQFRDAVSHMLYARRGRGFDLDDLIAAFEQETHQNVAAFVRTWLKKPGVPEEFRQRYEAMSASFVIPMQEPTP